MITFCCLPDPENVLRLLMGPASVDAEGDEKACLGSWEVDLVMSNEEG